MRALPYCLFTLTAAAFPDMDSVLSDIDRRQSDSPTTEMIGDLSDRATTEVGRRVRDCIAGTQTCEDQAAKSYTAPGELGSTECDADTCCVWEFIQRDIVPLFRSTNETCNNLARSAVRLGFHDAGAWSTTSDYGGADGSLLLSADEINRAENDGLQEVRSRALEILDNYSEYGVGAADLVQFMHNVATVVCPLGPRILTLVGRDDSRRANPPGLVPRNNVTDGEYLIELFRNKTFSPRDLAALVGAHTVAKQSYVDPSRRGQSLDSTPGIWDTEYYREITSDSVQGVFRLPSDEALSRTDGISSIFREFTDRTFGQTTWNSDYATAYVRLSLLGVNNINQLTDCTRVLPEAVTSFSSPTSSTSPTSSVGTRKAT
ncbi:hypothetical protein BDV06DRAFT_233436 [Aspergillus oleicola]